MSKEKNILIIEKSDFKLLNKKIDDSDGKKHVVLEGVFAVLNEMNRNKRIYTKEQYVPQIDRLQEKISSSTLLGELNHPVDRFDINLNEVSHVIEELRFDESSDKIYGKIRLLNTDKGQTAQRLVEDGIPLHISSRAAGSVNPDGTVVMKHLFTFDIVAEPGFAQAQLNVVNEKYGLSEATNLYLYELDEPMFNEENETDVEDTKKTTDVNATEVEEKSCKKSNIYNKKESDMNYVTEEQFERYTSYLKNKIERLTEQVKSSQKDNYSVAQTSNTDVQVLEEKYNKLVEFVNYLKDQINNSILHNDHIVENVIGLSDYIGYVVENLDVNMSYTNYLAESLDKNISYSNYIAEKVNKVANYSSYIAENANATNKELKNNKLYMEYVARSADKGIQYAEYLAERLDTGIQYAEHVGEKVNENINYSNYLKEELNKSINYSNYIAENLNSGSGVKQVKGNDGASYEDSITNRLDAILENSNKRKIESENKLHFIKFLDSDRIAIYSSLDESMKKKVIDAFEKNDYFSTADAVSIFESALKAKEEDYIANMKPYHREMWERLDEGKQAEIKLKASNYVLDTQAKVDNFWDNVDLRNEKVDFEPINENQNNDSQKTKGTDNYLADIEAELALRMRR